MRVKALFMRILVLNLSTAHASHACVQRRLATIANCIFQLHLQCNLCGTKNNNSAIQSDKERMNGNNADAIKRRFAKQTPRGVF